MAADRTVRVILTGDAAGLISAAERARLALKELGATNVGAVGKGVEAIGTSAKHAADESDKTKKSLAAGLRNANRAVLG